MGHAIALRLCVVRVFALLFTAFVVDEARAEEGESEPEKKEKKKKVIVVEKVNAPEIGASEAEIEIYLESFKDRERDLKERLRDARASGDEDQAAAIRDELRDLKELKKEEQNRLTQRNGGLIGGGAALTGLGGLSLVVGLVFGIIYWVDSTPSDIVGPGAIIGTVGGVVMLAAGTPMLAIGMKRVPREPSLEASRAPTAPSLQLGLTWSF